MMWTENESSTRTSDPEPRPGHALPQHYYLGDEVFRTDLRFLKNTQWLFVDHESRISESGNYFIFAIGADEFIVVRDLEGVVRAFHNVCRHRGSLVCLEPQGSRRALVCPYHGWTYRLDGSLRGAPHMPEDFDRSRHGLKHAHVATLHGLIFLNCAEGSPPPFDDFARGVEPFLALHRLGAAKIAARRRYPTHANWKLVAENFSECYHCLPAHKIYCAVHDAPRYYTNEAASLTPEAMADPRVRAQLAEMQQWERTTGGCGHLPPRLAEGPESEHLRFAARMPIGRGRLTQSLDGEPVAPLMGAFQQYDGGETLCCFNPLATLSASNDHAMLVRMIPRTPSFTDTEAIWLVRSDAVPGKDFDPDAVARMWDETLAEDKTIVENNHRGVRSSAYEPGPYSTEEAQCVAFISWYLRGTRAELARPS